MSFLKFLFILSVTSFAYEVGYRSPVLASEKSSESSQINCEMALSNVGPLVMGSTPLQNLDIHLFRLSLEKVTKQDVSLAFIDKNGSYALPPLSHNEPEDHTWTVELSLESENKILLSPSEKRLVLARNTELSQIDLETLIRQWLVGHPWHPYTSGKNLQLKPFQKEALKVYEGLRNRGEKKLLIVSPGSTGKTIIFKKILEELPSRPTRPLRIILTDQRMALRQIQNEIKSFNSPSHIWGDGNPYQSVADLIYDMKEKPSYFLFSTIQSFKLRLLKATPEERQALRQLTEIVIYDEAHHSGAAQARVLLPEWLGLGEEAPFFLGLTATPVHLEVSIQELFDGQVFWAYLDQAEEILRGHIKTERSVSELITQLELAIREGDITPIEHIYFMNSIDIQREGEELFITERVDEIGRYVLNPSYYPIVFSQLSFLLNQDAPGFIATATILEAERVQNYLNKYFPQKNIITLHSNLADPELANVERQLWAGEIDFVVTVKMLDESINLLGLQTYIDITSSVSPRQLIQRMSRVTRLNNKKHFAHVALFLNVNEFTVRESLEMVDRLLTSEIKGRVQTVSGVKFKNMSVPDEVLPLVSQEEDWKQLRTQLSAFWESARKTTDERFRELEIFILKNKLLPTSKSENLTERSLGGWLNNYKRSWSQDWFLKLSYEAQLILQNKNLLGRIYKTKEERFFELDHFIIQNGHLPSPRGSDPAEKSLGGWFSRYKRSHPQNWHLELSEAAKNIIQQKEMLVEKTIKSGKLRLEELNNFVLEWEKLPSVASKNLEEKSLAHWLAGYKQAQSLNWYLSLSDRVQKIIEKNNLLGRTNKNQDERLLELDEFILKFKRLPLSKSQLASEKSLARWVSGYKQSHPQTWHLALSESTQNILKEKALLGRQAKSKAERLQEINSFILNHQRLPSATSKNVEERSLRRWWLHYKKNQPQDWHLGLTEQAQNFLLKNKN